jgi:aspartate aminotransferase
LEELKIKGGIVMIRFASRTQTMGTEGAFEVLARAKELEKMGKEVFHFEIGEPDFDTPENIKKAAIDALKKGYTHYTPAFGLFEIREAVAKYITKTREFEVKSDNVIVTAGAKPAIVYAVLSLVEKGEEVIYPDPGYPIYSSAVKIAEAKAVPLPLLEEKDFRFDLSDLEKRVTDKTRMIIINSPHNPTGGILTIDDFYGIRDIIGNRDVYILADEIYSRIVYDGEFVSITKIKELRDKVILIDGFSKTYAMTGWRLGYAVADPEIIKMIAKYVINNYSCPTAFVQIAGIEALEGDQSAVDYMVKEFKERRDIIVEGLNSIKGVKCLLPKGAFYVFPNVKSFGKSSKEIQNYLLNEYGIACLPGTSFGEYGEGYLRFSYAASKDSIKKAIIVLKEAFERL